MDQLSLEMLATRLTAHLDCTQNVACRQILRVLAETGQPLAPIHLVRRLQMSPEHLAAHLAHVPDTEFNREGKIIGWGMTLVPTQHQFQVKDHALFTWCAFDTVLFPSLLQTEARVQSACSASGHPITFVAMPEGVVRELTPPSAILSLIIPTERSDCVRATFCAQSLFFESGQAASSFLSTHPDALILSIEEAAFVGSVVASRHFAK
jgi:alkylmercury lyase